MRFGCRNHQEPEVGRARIVYCMRYARRDVQAFSGQYYDHLSIHDKIGLAIENIKYLLRVLMQVHGFRRTGRHVFLDNTQTV